MEHPTFKIDRPTTWGIPYPYASGGFEPVTKEIVDWALEVRGEIPAALDGMFVRNTTNPPPVPYQGAYHWFVPDGMHHAVRLKDGRALWYKNRWVRTEELAKKLDVRAPAGPPETGYGPNTSSTALVHHAGRLLSMNEVGLPYEMSSDLDTIRRFDFGGKLKGPMCAHPRIDPETGEMYFFSNPPIPPFMILHTVSSEGELVSSRPIPFKGPSLKHDMAITENYFVFYDPSVLFDFEYAQETPIPYRWDDEYGSRLGIARKDAPEEPIRWFDIEPGFFVHFLNAYEDGGTIVVDAPYFSGPTLPRGKPDFLAQGKDADLFRWRIDLATGTIERELLSRHSFEYPAINKSLTGRPYRYGYGVTSQIIDHPRTGWGPLVKVDLESRTVALHDFGPGRTASEPVFVPDPHDHGEDAGWLLTYVYDEQQHRSVLAIIDARRFTHPAVAEIVLPQHVPFGFHALWVPNVPDGR